LRIGARAPRTERTGRPCTCGARAGIRCCVGDSLRDWPGGVVVANKLVGPNSKRVLPLLTPTWTLDITQSHLRLFGRRFLHGCAAAALLGPAAIIPTSCSKEWGGSPMSRKHAGILPVLLDPRLCIPVLVLWRAVVCFRPAQASFWRCWLHSRNRPVD